MALRHTVALLTAAAIAAGTVGCDSEAFYHTYQAPDAPFRGQSAQKKPVQPVRGVSTHVSGGTQTPPPQQKKQVQPVTGVSTHVYSVTFPKPEVKRKPQPLQGTSTHVYTQPAPPPPCTLTPEQLDQLKNLRGGKAYKVQVKIPGHTETLRYHPKKGFTLTVTEKGQTVLYRDRDGDGLLDVFRSLSKGEGYKGRMRISGEDLLKETELQDQFAGSLAGVLGMYDLPK